MSRTEYLYRLVALREKRKLERQFVYNQTMSIERELDRIKKEHPTVAEALEEVENLAASIRAYQDEM
jgi:hypothetical protein